MVKKTGKTFFNNLLKRAKKLSLVKIPADCLKYKIDNGGTTFFAA